MSHPLIPSLSPIRRPNFLCSFEQKTLSSLKSSTVRCSSFVSCFRLRHTNCVSPVMSSRNEPSPKKSKINEAGDNLVAGVSDSDQQLPTQSSHNDVMELFEEYSTDEINNRFVNLNFKSLPEDENRCLTRSDLSMDWRNAAASGSSKMFPSKQMMTQPKYQPSVTMQPFNMYLPGPNEDAIKKLLKKTGYSLFVSPRQRTYGGPPPNWTGSAPDNKCQVFVGKIPRQLFEDTLVPLFEKAGKIYEMRLMMEGSPSVISRGYGFVMYTDVSEARRAETKLDNWEIIPGYHIKVALSEPFTRLFLSHIPKQLRESEVEREIESKFPEVTDICVKPAKGFCFITFKDHRSAAKAKKEITTGIKKLFNVRVAVDFADHLPEPDERTMSEVKSVHVTGFRTQTTDAELKSIFQACGEVEKIKRVPGQFYAFIHFKERSEALTAIEKFHNELVNGSRLQVTLAKPPVDPLVRSEAIARRLKRLQNQKKSQPSTSPPSVFEIDSAVMQSFPSISSIISATEPSMTQGSNSDKYVVIKNGVVASKRNGVVVIKQY